MSSFNIVYKHSRGFLHSVIFQCPFDDLSLEDQEAFVKSFFLKVNPKSKVISVFLLGGDDL